VTGDCVVHDLVPPTDVERIGAVFAVDHDTQNEVTVCQVVDPVPTYRSPDR